MSVRRFIGANSREAMRQVRAALGDDALILSNRRVGEGVEILALADDEHGHMTGQGGATTPAAPPSPRAAVPSTYPRQPDRPSPSRVSAPVVTPTSAQPAVDFAAFSERVLGEMQDLRALLSSQVQQGASASPAEGGADRLRQRLFAVGFGARLVEEVLGVMPTELLHAEAEEADAWLSRQLASRLSVLDDESALLDAGGVFALVGPTGIGKTTTTAKLAARYVMRHGGAGVALVTTDSYRIGAHEQLRIYARLLGIEVHALEADAPLGDLLTRLADKRLVIIDTVGMSQRDQRLVGQIAMLGDSPGALATRPIRRMLLLNAASHGDTLEEVVDTYQRASLAAGAPLYGAILTKVDEAPRLGAVLDIAIRHGLRLHYVSHGQQVPEDLRLADRNALVEQALEVAGTSSFAPELSTPKNSGQRIQALSRGLLGQGRALAAALKTLRHEIAGFALLEQAWPMLGYPLEQQRRQAPILLEKSNLLQQTKKEAIRAMLWGRTKAVGGVDWPMPSLVLNASGHAQATPWLSHRQPVGENERLLWVDAELGAQWHLLPGCPGVQARDTLSSLGTAWLATVKGNIRVLVGGERYTLAALPDHAEPASSLTCRYRGREIRLVLSRLSIALNDGEYLDAWFGNLYESDTGRLQAQRYWLSPRYDVSASSVTQAIVAQLAHDELPGLARRAWRMISESNSLPIDQELHLLIASALAAVSCRLDQERTAWAMDVRALVLGLLGGRKSRSSSALLEGLVHLFTARDAFRLAGGGLDNEGVR